jgi:MoaA/NifB/PqqE/SkfB family radical SAM enzyme
MLSLAAFKQLIDANPSVKYIELSNYGEAFLNPNLLDMLAYAEERGVWLSVLNGANLNNVRPEVLEGVVKYRLWAILCSIDGATQATYEKYRVRGEIDTVLANIAKINEFKKKYDSPWPQLVWQFIVFGHNEHEIELARAMAEERGMLFLPKMNWDGAFSPLRDPALVQLKTGLTASSEQDYAKRNPGRVNEWHVSLCSTLWHRPQINIDGRLLGCGVNYWGDFGNAFDDGLQAAFNGEKIEYARGMLLGRNPERSDIPCSSCDYYREMKKHENYFSEEDVREPRRALRIEMPPPKSVAGPKQSAV